MNTLQYFKERFEQLQSTEDGGGLGAIRKDAYKTYNKLGIPAAKHEEWKYTRIGTLFNKEYQLPALDTSVDVDPLRLPGHEDANELFFINGEFSSSRSKLRSEALVVSSLDEAAKGEYGDLLAKHLGHSNNYLKDGINALNLALVKEGVFVYIKKGLELQHPIYIYNITDARAGNIFSQPRSFIYLAQRAQVQVVETFITLGNQESFTNQVMEVVVEQDAKLEYYKIQNDASHTNQVSTTHIRQIGKSYTYAVTISLDGSIVRNNTNFVLEAEYCEAHLYGLYFQHGSSHVDNHTVVDNVQPNCFSNELYKGILNGEASGVFNGKIFVRPQAQKTNAYQSNKNVLLSGSASVNTKPQLEIFADDVKCSHGCTIGKLDEEGLFYLQSRGIPANVAKSLLLHGFAMDILDKIKLAPIRSHVDHLISERLELI
jgi:Fe-S cluster assembly protein SufD